MKRGDAILVTAFHKEGIPEFVKEVAALTGCKILASSGTTKALKTAGVTKARDIAKFVGNPILDHMVVSLDRKIYAGLLADTELENHLQELEKLGVPRIGMVVIDFYPLAGAVVDPTKSYAEVNALIDIGGPTMASAAAKGGRLVICDVVDRRVVLEYLRKGVYDEEFQRNLEAKADFMVSKYRMLSANYKSGGRFVGIFGERVEQCLYGENSSMVPAFHLTAGSSDPLALDKFVLRAGKSPSYNNRCDIDRMLQTVTHIAASLDVNGYPFGDIAVGVKHGNCCGASVGVSKIRVLERMLDGDRRAIHGGLVMANFPIGEREAEVLLGYHLLPGQGRRLLDGIVAPAFSEEAIKLLERKKDKCRFLENPALANLDRRSIDTATRFRYVRGGILTEPNYTFILDLDDPRIKRFGPDLTNEERLDIVVGVPICHTSNSNTSTIMKDRQLLGNGVNQQDRVGSIKLAGIRAIDAGHNPEGGVLIEDSFMPFRDGVEEAAKIGIRIIFGTSGSVNDSDVQKCCEENGITLFMIPDTDGRGFYGH